MLKALLLRGVSRLERRFDYDASYLREVADVSVGAAWRLSALSLISGYQGGDPEIWAGALLASTLEGDCGPCAQLVVDASLAAGVDPVLLRAAARRDFEAAGATGLGFRFAEAAIAGHADADDLREEIVRTRGEKAALAAAFAAATGRAYPVLKRALGHGEACQALRIGDGAPIAPKRAGAAPASAA